MHADCDERSGNSLLYRAARDGDLPTVVREIKSTPVDAVNRTGENPLHAVARILYDDSGVRDERPEIVQRLVESGVKLQQKNLFGETPLTLAIKSRHVGIQVQIFHSARLFMDPGEYHQYLRDHIHVFLEEGDKDVEDDIPLMAYVPCQDEGVPTSKSSTRAKKRARRGKIPDIESDD